MSEILGYHHLSLSVTDLERSVAWYREALSLEVEAEIEGAGFRRVRLQAPGGALTLTLTSHDQQSGEPFDERRAGLDHVAFHVGDLVEVQNLKGHFERLGTEHSDVKEAANGSAMITLRDPDNIQLEVFGGPVDPAIAAGHASQA